MQKRRYWVIATALLLIGCPWLAVRFAGSAGMAVCFLLFFGVNPLFSLFCGVFAGKDIRERWMLPILTAALFMAGVWLFFEMGEPAFLIYAAGYLVIGVSAMLISAIIRIRKK